MAAAIEQGIERMKIINENLRGQNFRDIGILHIHPSQMLSELAESRIDGLPHMLRFLISGLGSPKESSEILSYLAFDPIYLNSLVELGYKDVLAQKPSILQFLRI